VVKKTKFGYRVFSKTGKPISITFTTRKAAQRRQDVIDKYGVSGKVAPLKEKDRKVRIVKSKIRKKMKQDVRREEKSWFDVIKKSLGVKK
jgi:hypothetical protein